MLNSILKVDLHIHSKASEYKDGKLVQNGTKDNLPVLFGKLEKYGIGLFAITDHNRFDKELYVEAKRIISTNEYPSVKNIIPGVEFDVVLEENKKRCHIVTLFDAKNSEDLDSIAKGIENHKLTKSEESYSKESYEKILCEIGLNCILIVHQKVSLNSKKGKTQSLSESTNDPYRAIQIGYVDALEYQTPHVEGIIKSNLEQCPTNISLITGSDCHQWDQYPLHDAGSRSKIEQFTTFKCLPTFKGILMAITSPNTRINVIPKTNKNRYIKSYRIDRNEFQIDPGINVIVGENGSGKTTLLSLLSNKKNVIKDYVKDIQKNSKFVLNDEVKEDSVWLVEQAMIVDKYNNGSLFEKSDFLGIDNSIFEESYKDYANKIKRIVEHNIVKNDKTVALRDVNIAINSNYEKPTHFINIKKDFIENKDNKEKNNKDSLNKILKLLKKEISKKSYLPEETRNLINAYDLILKVYRSVLLRYYTEKNETSVRSIILNQINEYELDMNKRQTGLDSSIASYKTRKTEFINSIVELCELSQVEMESLKTPDLISGKTENEKNGFVFCTRSEYDKKNMENSFYKKMFTSKYRDADKIKSIKTREEFKEAIMGCTDTETIDTKYNDNLSSFLREAEKTISYIVESGTGNTQGQTLGELSLTYYKYHLNDNKNNVRMVFIDQPEDNISNNHISEELISYFNKMRKDKQIFIVTHNPLLVVNLDADNVIITSLKNGKLEVKSGCLEDEQNKILNYIATAMDGGVDSLRRRFRIYENNSNI